ncbi:hypothetical protein [Thermococcus radiotolerans]|uniref:Uncharacterized protein n=1 Tax=Thermococcus radiotolerans TaxID=187880 RepID=A0A2Z2N511_9EURY|nr:hypothetical protein [Thermococcus radiotolerans]ASJ14662.1 hypothetical protein A3L10_05765 [Thermococcus radiotolerans]
MGASLFVDVIAIAVLVLFLLQFLRLAVTGGSKKELYLTLALFSITLGVWLIYNASFTWGWDFYTYVPLAFAVATFLLSVFGLFRLREEEGLGGFQKEI